MMKGKYNIRPLVKEDVEAIVNLVRTSFESSYLIPSIYRGKGIGKFISYELENKLSPYKYFVLWNENIIAGYAEYKIFESTSTAFLNIISVSNDCKNKGIGRILYEYSKKYFLERGFETIALDVYESNSIALNWYAHIGFKQINSNSLYQIDVKKENQDSKTYIQNYAQYKALYEVYGFYFLDIVIGNENIRLGTIGRDLIVRGNYSQSLKEQLPILSNVFELEKVYFIGSDNMFKEFEFIDRIIRMELNIK